MEREKHEPLSLCVFVALENGRYSEGEHIVLSGYNLKRSNQPFGMLL